MSCNTQKLINTIQQCTITGESYEPVGLSIYNNLLVIFLLIIIIFTTFTFTVAKKHAKK